MANFAEIDSSTNEVIRVVIVDNEIQTSDGRLGDNDKHADGETWCNNFWGTNNSYWKQTSFSGSFRGKYARPGLIYNSTEDRFIDPKPFSDWVRNDYTSMPEVDWLPPTGFVPVEDHHYTIGDSDQLYLWKYAWDSSLQTFKATKDDDPDDNNEYKYNFTTNDWEVIT